MAAARSIRAIDLLHEWLRDAGTYGLRWFRFHSSLVPSRSGRVNRTHGVESYGSAITQGLGRLDGVTTVAPTAVSLAEATDEEWQLANQAIGIGRGWDVACRLVSTVDLPGKEFPGHRTP